MPIENRSSNTDPRDVFIRLNPLGISCIRDSQLQAGNERLLSPHETQPEPTPALAPGRWIDERYLS